MGSAKYRVLRLYVSWNCCQSRKTPLGRRSMRQPSDVLTNSIGPGSGS
ncbi:Uncharacterised protein [Mycobacterium tuberculosis]|nr:Uncharacterised protein [Mycobacterium tuberculosis]